MERVVGSLAGVSGYTFDLEYDLFFTTERVIAVIVQHPADTQRQFTPIWTTMFLGSGWETRKEQREREKIAQERRRSSQNLAPGELVTTHSRNIEIWYGKITSVEVVRRLLQWQLRFYLLAPPTTARTIHFNLSKRQIPEARRLLELVLLSKINRK